MLHRTLTQGAAPPSLVAHWIACSGGQRPLQCRASAINGRSSVAADRLVPCSSFSKAYVEAQSSFDKVPGLQEFAGAVWERRKRIPSVTFNDPLTRLFDEFDADGDGHLTAAEVASALQSRDVQLSEAAAQKYINAIDANANGLVEREEFGDLIFKMAASDRSGTMPVQNQAARPLKRVKSLTEVGLFKFVLEKDPSLLHIPGLQAYAASVWDRRRHVPAPTFRDPLGAVFDEFDADGDGHLTAAELVAALAAQGVGMSRQQAELIIDAVDTDRNGTLEKDEFPALIFGLANLNRLIDGAPDGGSGEVQ